VQCSWFSLWLLPSLPTIFPYTTLFRSCLCLCSPPPPPSQTPPRPFPPSRLVLPPRLLEHLGDRHRCTAARFGHVGRGHEGEDLDRLLGWHRHFSGLEEAHDLGEELTVPRGLGRRDALRAVDARDALALSSA